MRGSSLRYYGSVTANQASNHCKPHSRTSYEPVINRHQTVLPLPVYPIESPYKASPTTKSPHHTIPIRQIPIDTDTASTNPTDSTNSDTHLHLSSLPSLPPNPHHSKSDSAGSAHHRSHNPPDHHTAAGHFSRRDCRSVDRARLGIDR